MVNKIMQLFKLNSSCQRDQVVEPYSGWVIRTLVDWLGCGVKNDEGSARDQKDSNGDLEEGAGTNKKLYSSQDKAALTLD